MELLSLVVAHWDTIGLVLTNIVALFIKPPFRKSDDFSNIHLED